MYARFLVAVLGAISAISLAGCANSTESESAAIAPGQAPVPPAVAPVPPYQLTPEELALNCKKLTGRMQVRILQVRDFETRKQASQAAQITQKAATAVGGSAQQAVDPETQNARDRAQLEAYNKQLAAKNCKTFNLEEELKPKPVTATPTPVAKPAKSATAKPAPAAPAATPPPAAGSTATTVTVPSPGTEDTGGAP
jgi:hypothetical protein